MIANLITEVAEETIDNHKNNLQISPSFMNEIDTGSSEIGNQNQFSNDFEILKYVEDNLVSNFVDNEIEDLVINIMQEIYFMNKKIPQIISEEIFFDMLRVEIRNNA